MSGIGGVSPRPSADVGPADDVQANPAAQVVLNHGAGQSRLPASATDVFPPRPKAEQQAIAAEIKAQNQGQWGVDTQSDPRLPAFSKASRFDPEGPAVALTSAEAQAKALDFVKKNAAALGIPADVVGKLKTNTSSNKPGDVGFAVSDGKGGYDGAQWWVNVDAPDAKQHGYEQFGNAKSHYGYAVLFGSDGNVRTVESFSLLTPKLHLNTHPKLGPDDARLTASIVGKPVVLQLSSGSHYGAIVGKENLGALGASDIKSKKLILFESDHGSNGQVSYTLAYQISCKKNGHDCSFVVDANNGQLLQTNAPKKFVP